MNIKTINKVLTKKFNEFVASIDDKKVQEQVIKNSIITGGSIVSMLLDEDVNDYDIYFTNLETVRMVANYYLKKFIKDNPNGCITKDSCYFDEEKECIHATSQGIATKAPTGEKFEPVCISGNAITLTDKIQLIIRFYGEPEEIVKNYDFVHCKSYWTSITGEVVTTALMLGTILAKELIFTGSKYPVCSIMRTRKFIQRGWSITSGQYLKMCIQISELDLKNVEVLKDQLTGVDSTYFNRVLEAIETNNLEKVNSGYLFKLIDELF